MWVKQGHKPAMTGNGETTTYKPGDDWGMVRLWNCLTHIILFFRGAIATNLKLCPVLSIKRRNKEWMFFQSVSECPGAL